MTSAKLGKARRMDDASGRYIEFCKSTFPNHLDLRGMRLVVDCANGAAYHIAPHVFHELGADVESVGAHPDGFNINAQVGATSPGALQAAVQQTGADLGIALDGDGDRLVMVDGAGKLYDGDQLLYVIACHRRKARELGKGVVGTLRPILRWSSRIAKLKVPFARARVGDRYVLEMLAQRGWQLGGENSGHIVCLDKHSTGDGIISALQVLRALIENRVTLSKAAGALALFPQVLLNVAVGKQAGVLERAEVKRTVAEAEADLDGSGRILLRPSEPSR